MIYEFSLVREDYLRHQLFIASMSKSMKKKRFKSWMILTIVMLVLGILFLEKKNMFLSYYFFGASILSLFFYPFYYKKKLKNHYRNFIDETCRNKFGLRYEIQFVDGTVIVKRETVESKIKIIEFEQIFEIKENLFIQLKLGDTIIIPFNMPAFNSFKEELKTIISPLNVHWYEKLDWEWK